MGFLDKIKNAPAKPAQQAAAKATAAKPAPTTAPRSKYAGLNDTEPTVNRTYLKNRKSLGTHVLKVIKISEGVLPKHANGAGSDFFSADFEVVESDTLKAGEERSWMTVDGAFDYFFKEIKGYLEALVGGIQGATEAEIAEALGVGVTEDGKLNFDELADRAVTEDNPFAGLMLVAECYEGKKDDPKTGLPYINVKFMALPADDAEQGADGKAA